jgi:hypothetical protein
MFSKVISYPMLELVSQHAEKGKTQKYVVEDLVPTTLQEII